MMITDPKASIMIIFVVSILSFAIACACGSLHIGEDLSEQILPTSITSSDDMIKPIKENNFTATTISIVQPQQTTTTTNYTRNYTRNTTNNTTNTSSNGSNSNYSRSNNTYRTSSSNNDT